MFKSRIFSSQTTGCLDTEKVLYYPGNNADMELLYRQHCVKIHPSELLFWVSPRWKNTHKTTHCCDLYPFCPGWFFASVFLYKISPNISSAGETKIIWSVIGAVVRKTQAEYPSSLSKTSCEPDGFIRRLLLLEVWETKEYWGKELRISF